MEKEVCGEKEQLRLIGGSYDSPFMLRVHIALALKGIAYEFIWENM